MFRVQYYVNDDVKRITAYMVHRRIREVNQNFGNLVMQSNHGNLIHDVPFFVK